MDLSIISLLIFDDAFFLLAEGNDVDAIFGESYEVEIFWEDDAHDFGFPELKGFVSEEGCFDAAFGIWDVNELDIVSINVNNLVAYHQFSQALLSNNKQISICYIQLIFPLHHKHIFPNILRLKPNKKYS